MENIKIVSRKVVNEEKTEIWGVPNLYKGRCAPQTPLAKKIENFNLTLR